MSIDPNPFRSLERQFEQLQRQLEATMDVWDGDRFDVPGLGGGSRMGVDLVDHDDEYVLTADVPGFEADDIDIRLTDDRIHIAATHEREASEQDEEEEGVQIKSERKKRRLQRALRLPEPIEVDGAEAQYRNGVLTITLPKVDPSEADGKKIDVATS